MEISAIPLRAIYSATPEELARAKHRIDRNTAIGVIEPSVFDPLTRRKLCWPDPRPN